VVVSRGWGKWKEKMGDSVFRCEFANLLNASDHCDYMSKHPLEMRGDILALTTTKSAIDIMVKRNIYKLVWRREPASQGWVKAMDGGQHAGTNASSKLVEQGKTVT
jgi:hypothetical protein